MQTGFPGHSRCPHAFTTHQSIRRIRFHQTRLPTPPVACGEAGCVEDDERYRRVDYSSRLAYDARQAFAKNIAQGDACMDLALAALHVAAEDDAIISISPVSFPVASFLKRIEGITLDIAKRLVSTNQDVPVPPDIALPIISKCLFEECGFEVPDFGKSNLQKETIMEHPGVWEDQRFAYMNEMLIRRVGVPALLTILYQDVMKRLLLSETIDFVVSMDSKGFTEMPQASVIHGMSREATLRDDGLMLNTCTSDALVEVLQHLKRSFWPYPWDTNEGDNGGFRGAALNLLDGGLNSSLDVISRTAKHRLDRGIFTTTGAGDIRRVVLACERLVMLCGESRSLERRDLAILLCHEGKFGRARAEIECFMDTQEYETSSVEDKALVQQIHSFMSNLSDNGKLTMPPAQVMSIDFILGLDPPEVDPEKRISLTW